MSIFDRLKQSAVDAAATAATAIGNKRETFTFTALPESLAQMQALPEAALDTPLSDGGADRAGSVRLCR